MGKAENIISQVLERMLPVGSIVEWAPVEGGKADLSSADKVAAYYGFGTWEAYGAGQFLLGVGGSYQAGNTGGEAEHTLTQGELPNVSVGVEVVFSGPSGSSVYVASNTGTAGTPYNSADAGKTKPLGSGQAHNNMPPYIAVYRWRRIT